MRRARRFVRHTRRQLGALLIPIFAPKFVNSLAESWQSEQIDLRHRESASRSSGVLFALWHGRMLLGMPFHGGQPPVVLVSMSDDGSLVVPLLKSFGYGVIRGSTSRGGARAMRELLTELRRGGSIVITPDGPRGPLHAMNPGLAWMSRATGFPILPLGFACDQAWRLKSWDRFTIAKPGARVRLCYGEPLYVGREGGEAALESATEEIRLRMFAAEQRAFDALGVERDW